MLLTVLEFRLEEASREAWQGYHIDDWPRPPQNHPRQECLRRLQATLHQLPPLLFDRASEQLASRADKFFHAMNNVIETIGWSFCPIDASEYISLVTDMIDAPLPVGSPPWAKRDASPNELPFEDVGWV